MMVRNGALGRRSLLCAGAAVPLVGLVSPGAVAQPAAASPVAALPNGAGFYRTKVGEVAVTIVSDGQLVLGEGLKAIMAANASDEDYAAALQAAFLPPTGAPLHLNAVTFMLGGRRYLVDTGYGAGGSTSSGAVLTKSGRLLANLARAGIAPDQVDVVILTHAHSDHIGGVFTAEGGLAFPKATLLIGAAEKSFWEGAGATLPNNLLPPERQKGMIDGAKAAIARAGKALHTFVAGREIAPGLTALDTSGHTPGHISLRLTSGGESLLIAADIGHFYATAPTHPAWHVGFDVDKDKAVATRTSFYKEAAAERSRVLLYHFPFPGLGHLEAQGAAYRWTPEPFAF